MIGAVRQSATAAGLVIGCLSLPVMAMPQCPVEPVRSAAFVAAGYLVLALMACLGIAAPLLTWRGTRASRPVMRALLLSLAAVAMLGIWLAGLRIWLRHFVWPC